MTTAIEQLDAMLERHRQGYQIEYGDLMEIRSALERAQSKITLIPKSYGQNIVRQQSKGSISGDDLPIAAWQCDPDEPTEAIFIGSDCPNYGAFRQSMVDISDVLSACRIPVVALPKPVQEAVLKKNRLIVEHQQSDNPEGGAA